MTLDLHLHSTASDGTLSPEEVVNHALAAGLDAIALTDHDTVAGVRVAKKAAEGKPLAVIPGIEVSTTASGLEGGRDLHILGYFVDPEHPALREYETQAREGRENRIREMIERLRGMGVEVSFEAVLEAAGEDRVNLARPHLARALVAEGHVGSFAEAFDRYIGNEHPAYVPTRLLTPSEGIRLVADAGGIPVWAHPRDENLDLLLPEMVRVGLRGLEVYRPDTPPRRVEELKRRAREAGLVVSGGSDWHGPDDGPLGAFRVRGEDVAELLRAGGM